VEIIGEVIRERSGPARALAIGGPELSAVIARAGHELVDVKDYRAATVVAVGNDFDLSYERVTSAARAAARGAPLVTPNIDPRMPIEEGDFLPGSGATVAAIATAAGVRPVVVGKPEAPLFRIALERIGLPAAAAAMVGDGVRSDIRGAQAVGMVTVLYAPEDVCAAGRRGAGAPPAEARLSENSPAGEADLVVASFAELARLAGVF